MHPGTRRRGLIAAKYPGRPHADRTFRFALQPLAKGLARSVAALQQVGRTIPAQAALSGG
jgi:hypothetical protein